MEFKTLSEAAYTAFAKQQPLYNMWQTPDMAHLRNKRGWDYTYVGVTEGDAVLAAAMLSYRTVFLGKRIVQAARGFSIDYHNEALLAFFHERLLDYLKENHCMVFQTDPYLPYKERDENGDLVEGGFDNSSVVEQLQKLGYRHDGFLRGTDIAREPNWMFVTDLRGKSEEELFKSFDQRARRMINKTTRQQIRVREITEKELPRFKRIMDHTAGRRGFDDHDSDYYRCLFDTFGKSGHMKVLLGELDVARYEAGLKQEAQEKAQALERTKQALAEKPGHAKTQKKYALLQEEYAQLNRRIEEAGHLWEDAEDGILTLSGCVFICVGREVLYLYGGSYQKYMQFNAAYAIQWHMMRQAMKEGYDFYNFYGISGIFDKKDEGYGVYEFKRGFTGSVVQLIGDFRYIVSPASYRLYELLRGIKHKLRR